METTLTAAALIRAVLVALVLLMDSDRISRPVAVRHPDCEKNEKRSLFELSIK
jgi:hypothetical protein